MATRKTVKKAPRRPSPQISAITPADLGVKAAFWDRKKRGKVTFRPIVGWASVCNYVEAQRLPFVAVVLNDYNSPSLATNSTFPDFVGYFKKNVSADQAQKIIERYGVQLGGAGGAGGPLE